MKRFVFATFLIFSSLTSAEIIELPFTTNYSIGFEREDAFNASVDIASYLFEADFGVEEIYGFQLYIELDPRSVFFGTSTLGYGINNNYLFNGGLYRGINLNELSPSVMRYSIYKKMYIEEQYLNKFFVAYAYDKNEFSRFRFTDTKLFISTSPEDRFEPDTANAPFLPEWGQPLTFAQVPEPSTIAVMALGLLGLGAARRRKA